MKKRILTLLFIALLCVTAQGERIEQIDWSQGLVTARGKLNRNFGAADVCHNIDLTRPGLTPRKGYSLVVDVPGIDSILWNGIDALDYRNGDKQLLVVGKWTDSAYAGLFVSELNGFGFGVVDTFKFAPDTATTNAEVIDSGYTQGLWAIEIRRTGSFWSHEKFFDTTTVKSVIVDTFVNWINAESGLNSFVTASRDNDTLFIGEDGEDFGIQVFANFTELPGEGFIWGAWDSTKTSDSSETMTAIANRFPSTGTPQFAQTRDQVYVVNGVARARVFDGRFSSEYPARAPGEPSILPLATAGTLEGYYRYAIKFSGPDTSLPQLTLSNALGYISQPVRVDSGQVLIYNFPLPLLDTFYTMAGLSGDDVDITIWRTTGDSRVLDEFDTLWLIDSVTISEVDWPNPGPGYGTATFTDTTSDFTLRDDAGEHEVIGELWGGYDNWRSLWLDTVNSNYDTETFPPGHYDSNHTLSHVQMPGAPSFYASGATGGDTLPSGIWQLADTAVSWFDAAGFSWIVVFVDTLSGAIVSDSGASLNMFHPTQSDGYNQGYLSIVGDTLQLGFRRSQTESMKIVIPRTPDTTVMALLYRGPIRPIAFDTLWAGGFPAFNLPQIKLAVNADEWEVLQYYLLGTFNPGDTVLDTLHYDSLLFRDPYRRNAPPSAPLDAIASGNRLILMDRQNVYMGNLLDSGATFNVLQQKPIEPDDGDQNVTLWAQSQGVIKIAKNNSTYNLFRSGGIWQLPELSRHYGVVAPLSHAAAPEGDYFLSADGVRLETEGIYRSRSIAPLLMSGNLINFKDVAISDLKTAVGTYFDNKYILSIPALDTSFVLNRIIGEGGQSRFAWSTWDLIMTGATKFRVSDDNIIMPGDSLYFIKSGESKIYVFNDGIYDNGQQIIWQWRSGPSNKVDGQFRQVDRAEIYVTSADTVSLGNNSLGLFSLIFFDENGTNYTADDIHTIADLDTANYLSFDQPGTEVSLFWRLFIGNTAIHLAPSAATTIEGAWLTISKQEEYPSQ